MSELATRQEITFRQDEVQTLFDLVAAGASASVIGMSGTGKSNLFDHLCDPVVQADYFDSGAKSPIVVRVNFHYAPNFEDRSLYSIILESLELLEGEMADRLAILPQTLARISQLHDALIDAGGDILKVQRCFKQAIRALLSGSQRKLVFLFDQFDEVYQDAEDRFFANLRGLRQSYKYRLSYFVFTRDRLPNLTPPNEAREEFYELLAANEMGLKPYNKADALGLLRRVAARYQLVDVITDELADALIAMTGGHAGMLRAAFLAVARGETALRGADDLLQVSNVRLECDKVWQSLSPQEQRVLHVVLNEAEPDEEATETVDQLRVKGVLHAGEPLQLFAPLFAAYVKTQDPLWERPLHFDPRSRQVMVFGRQTPPLTKLEYKLFRQLYERRDELVSKDELVDAGWPDAHGGVSDEALTAAIARLRKKVEPDPKEPRFFENVRNQGYILRVEEG